MFRLFSRSSSKECPVPADSKEMLSNGWAQITGLFDREMIRNRKVLVPHHSDFPIRYNGDRQTAFDTLDILAGQMEIDGQKIRLELFSNGAESLGQGGFGAQKIFMSSYKNVRQTIGAYEGVQEDGKYVIFIDQKELTDPESLVATLAFDLALIKLLGEKRVEKTSQLLNELTVLIYGLGVFKANTAFRTLNTIESTGHSSRGYLKQREWGYALALYARLRGEVNPEWTKYLNKNLQSDFLKSQAWLTVNQ